MTHRVLGVLLILVGMVQVAGGEMNAEARRAVEEDWDRQDRMRHLTPGSREAFGALLERADRAAGDLRKAGRGELAEELMGRVREVARAGVKVAEVGRELATSDGLRLVRCILCGSGEGDEGRVRGEDYTFKMGLKWKGQAWGLPCVSWDKEAVVYRLEGLVAGGRYRLRLFYATDGARKEEAVADGVALHTVELKAGEVEDRWADLPAEVVADGKVELRVRRVGGANAVVTAIEVWSDRGAGDEKQARVAAGRHERIEASNAGPEAVAAYRAGRWLVREMLFGAPGLNFEQLVFVRRHWPQMNHQCAHRVGEAQTPGANVCVLEGLRPDGRIRELLPAELAEGSGVGRPDLSFDGRRVVFPLARPRVPAGVYRSSAGHAKYDPKDPADSRAYRGGPCHMYDIYEIGIDGKGLRRLTDDDNAEDTEPCYLPDGRIAFTSSRDGRMVQCGDWALVFGLWTMNADGSNQRPITEPQDTEFYPAMLDDGRILYTRWDYVMKAYNVIQQLWVVNPDGTRSQMAYGDWFDFSRGPTALFEARQIPGTRKVVAIGAAHHNTAVGPVMVVDLNQHRAGPGGMVNLTPEIGYPEAYGDDERTVRQEPDVAPISNAKSAAGWYASPWPVGNDLFLVCYSYEAPSTARDAYGIYLLDRHGNRELVFRGKDYSCYAPMPLLARQRPKVIPAAVASDASTPGTFYVQDVYAGLEGVPRGTVKWLRVCETYVKKRHTDPHRCDAGVSSGYDFRGVLGMVPVEEDGSASFIAPAGKLLFFEVLDKNLLEVRRMRNYVNLMPGETRGCVGCHEVPGMAGLNANKPKAMQREPSVIQPPPWGAGPMEFAKVVQPVLERNCVGCHDGGAEKDHGFDLRGRKMVKAPTLFDHDEGAQHCVSDSFLALLPHVRYVKVGGYQGEKLPLKPYAVGSGSSALMKMLGAGHRGVKLPEGDWHALGAWIDCNAPFYGSYDGIETVARP